MDVRRTSLTAHETRNRILDAAQALFVAHGFEATSMRMITGDAGVNLAAVNYHFGSKDALVDAVLRGVQPGAPASARHRCCRSTVFPSCPRSMNIGIRRSRAI